MPPQCSTPSPPTTAILLSLHDRAQWMDERAALVTFHGRQRRQIQALSLRQQQHQQQVLQQEQQQQLQNRQSCRGVDSLHQNPSWHHDRQLFSQGVSLPVPPTKTRAQQYTQSISASRHHHHHQADMNVRNKMMGTQKQQQKQQQFHHSNAEWKSSSSSLPLSSALADDLTDHEDDDDIDNDEQSTCYGSSDNISDRDEDGGCDGDNVNNYNQQQSQSQSQQEQLSSLTISNNAINNTGSRIVSLIDTNDADEITYDSGNGYYPRGSTNHFNSRTARENVVQAKDDDHHHHNPRAKCGALSSNGHSNHHGHYLNKTGITSRQYPADDNATTATTTIIPHRTCSCWISVQLIQNHARLKQRLLESEIVTLQRALHHEQTKSARLYQRIVQLSTNNNNKKNNANTQDDNDDANADADADDNLDVEEQLFDTSNHHPSTSHETATHYPVLDSATTVIAIPGDDDNDAVSEFLPKNDNRHYRFDLDNFDDEDDSDEWTKQSAIVRRTAIAKKEEEEEENYDHSDHNFADHDDDTGMGRNDVWDRSNHIIDCRKDDHSSHDSTLITKAASIDPKDVISYHGTRCTIKTVTPEQEGLRRQLGPVSVTDDDNNDKLFHFINTKKVHNRWKLDNLRRHKQQQQQQQQ